MIRRPQDTDSPIESVGQSAARLAWTRRLARLGYASKAVVYAIVATLAVGAALDVVAYDPTDTRGALIHIGHGVLGRGVVLVLATGFLGLALWFVIEAAWNPRPRSNRLLDAVSRIGQAGGGLGYLALAVWAGQFAIFGGAAQASNSLVRSATSRFLATTAGAALVLIAAAIVIGVGIRQIRIGAARTFESWLELDRMTPWIRRWGTRLGTIGFCTQGIIFTFIGTSLIVAVVQEQAHEARGFDGVLSAIAAMPQGRLLLTVAGVGLYAYAVFASVEGTYKRMTPR